MSIWSPTYHWPPPPVVGGGGEGGGAGANGGWEPGGGCPVINVPWTEILATVKDDAGTLYNDELWQNDEGASAGWFFIDVVYSYQTGTIWYYGDETHDFYIDYTSPTMWHNPYTGATYDSKFYTRDDTLPGVQPWHFIVFDSLVRDSTHTDFIPFTDYHAAYLTGSEEWHDACFVSFHFELLTCICTLPLPWGQGGARGGAKGIIIKEILGLPLQANSLPIIDTVARNARRSRRHRLLGGAKEII